MCNCGSTRKLPVGAAGKNGTNGTNGVDGKGYDSTSATTMTIANSGSQTMTIGTNKAYLPGSRIKVSYANNPIVDWMEGVVTAYNTNTGSLTFTRDLSNGSGTFTPWDVSIAGEPGLAGTPAANLLPLDNVWTGINEFDSTILITQPAQSLPITAGGIVTVPNGVHGNIFAIGNPNNIATLNKFVHPDLSIVGMTIHLLIEDTGALPFILLTDTTAATGIRVIGPALKLVAGDLITLVYCGFNLSQRWRLEHNPKYGAWQAATSIYGVDQFSNAFTDDLSLPIRYRLEGEIVRIEGMVNNGTPSTVCDSSSVLLTLPVGFRPARQQSGLAFDQTQGIPLYITIATNGQVSIEYAEIATNNAYNVITGCNSNVSLNNITFPIT